MPKRPKVSVCIPTYCGSKTVGPAIDSVLRQTFVDFELIVIDDCSNDDTPNIVKSFNDPRIYYLRNERNLGPQENWNRCLNLANGQYFKLLPHDDLLHPRCLERQVAVLESDHEENFALVFCAREVIGPDGKVLARRGFPGGREGPISNSRIIRSCVRRGTNLLGEPGGVMFRKPLANIIGTFNATNPYVIDLDYWFRLLAHGNAYYFSETLSSFRVSRESWSVTIGKRQHIEFREFISRVSAHSNLPTTPIDQFCGRYTPSLNNFARLLFYQLYIR